MNSSPFFSIIIPTYNRAAFITKAIKSVLEQTYNDWELIIIDDGSTDNTKDVIKQFEDVRINYFFQKNQERSSARNNGIKKSKGKYICFLDSDDYYLNNRLQLLYNEINKLDHPTALLYTEISFESQNQILPKTELSNKNFKNHFDFIIQATIGVPQTCISKEILLKHNFNIQFNLGEDLELWLRIVQEYPLLFLPNQNTVVAIDHDDRSVNEKKNNPGVYQLKLFNFIFKKEHPGFNINANLKKEKISDAYFSIARHYMYNNLKAKAFLWILKALINNYKHIQNKHWLYCLKSLSFGVIPIEYRI